jgi:tRNA dimethylallyltransferase
MAERPPLLAIGGPTASGKTDLAIRLAQMLDGEIVNADSRQVYRGMDIGTAKPTPEQRVAVPHHLLDVVLPSEEFTLTQYTALAHGIIHEILDRGKLPVLVGGTGLYLRAVVRGYRVPEVPPDAELRRTLAREAAERGPVALVARLRAVDPIAAERIDGRNVRRVIRALEVSLALGAPFSSLQLQEEPYTSLAIVLHGSRAVLYTRADMRLQVMLDAGFEAEVARLLEGGNDPALPAMSALGYQELAAALRGEVAREAAIEATRTRTHDFIRRQITWFKAEREAQQLDVERPDLLAAALDLARRWRASVPS